MPEANPGKGAAASPQSAASSESSIFPDNFFPTARFYLSEHRLCSLHLGSFGSPFFVCHPEQTEQRVVILTEVEGSRSDPKRSRRIHTRLSRSLPGRAFVSMPCATLPPSSSSSTISSAPESPYPHASPPART